MKLAKLICVVASIVFIAGSVQDGYAQKRLTVQDTSIWMSEFVADGRLDEWSEPLQAYDENSAIEYSLANDDMYLYLVVRSNHTSKILFGGVSLTVERPGKPDVMVLYPYNSAHNLSGGAMEMMNKPGRIFRIQDAERIETAGIVDEGDSILFIANEYGIQAAVREAKVNTEMYPEGESHYVVEIAVPLQYLDLSPDAGARELNYRIGLRGVTLGSGMRGLMFGMGTSVVIVGGGSGSQPSRRQQEYERIKSRDMSVPTELKGTYRIAVTESRF